MEARVIGPAISPGQLFYEKAQRQTSNIKTGVPTRNLGPERPSSLLQAIRASFPPSESSRSDGIREMNMPQRYLTSVPPSGKPRDPFRPRQPNVDEELFWFDFTLVWSRGTTVYRTFTYDHEGQRVKKAMFAWFREMPIPTGSYHERSSPDTPSLDHIHANIKRTKKPAKKPPAKTFGPWATSYNASWSSRTITKTASQCAEPDAIDHNPLQRCLVVFLENIARVYFPSGEDKILPIPFQLDNAWPLPGGGLMLQRAANRKEIESRDKGKGRAHISMVDRTMNSLDKTMDLMLEELDNNAVGMDLGLQPVSNQARVYTVTHPTSEMMFLCHTPSLVGGHVNQRGEHRRASKPPVLHPLQSSMEVVFVSDAPEVPIYAGYDHDSNDLVFYRWARLRDQPDATVTSVDNVDLPPQPVEGMQENSDTKVKASNRQKRVSIAPEAIEFSRRPRMSTTDTVVDPPRRRPSLKRERSNTLNGHAVDSTLPQSGAEIVRAALNDNGNALDPKDVNARVRAEGEVIRGVSRKVERRWSTQASNRQRGRPRALHDLSETDLRETTMLMGLDKVERTILADVVGEEIRRWRLPVKILSVSQVEIFLSDILSPESAHVNIHVLGGEPRLHVFLLQKRKISPVRYSMTEMSSHPASYASAVICTRPTIQDVIITDPTSSRLSVITSHGQVCAVTLPAIHDRHTSSGVRILDATDSKVTAQLADGPLLRLDLDLNVRHPLTQQCLSALAEVLDAKQFLAVKSATLAYYRQKHHDWTLGDFGRALLSLLGVLTAPGTATPAKVDLDPWRTLLEDISEHRELHFENALLDHNTRSSNTTMPGREAVCSQNLPESSVPYILQALHITAEETKLIANRERDVLSLANLIVGLASHYQLHAWVDYWLRSAPSARKRLTATATRSSCPIPRHLAEPFNFTAFLGRVLREGKPVATENALLSPKKGTMPSLEYGRVTIHPSILHLLATFARLKTDEPMDQSKEECALIHLVNQGGDREWLTKLPWHLSLPIWEAIRALRGRTKTCWSLGMYLLLERLDVAAQLKMTRCRLPVDPWIHNVKEVQAQENYKQIMRINKGTPMPLDAGASRCYEAPSLPNLRFAHDRRLQDVERLLQYSRPRTIKIEDRSNMSDEDRQQYQQHMVDQIASRNFSSIMGYSILTFDSVEPSITERFPISPISTTVFVAPSTTAQEMKQPPHPLSWPLFHSGVAAALSIRDTQGVVDSSWIVFNKPEKLNSEHAGFLLGLGLSGKLRCLTPWASYPYLEARHEQTSLGLLLGMGASYAGSQDRLLTTVLSSHVSALLPAGSIELNTSPLVQAGSLMAIGLVHVASAAYRFAEASLNEIQRRLIPGIEPFTAYREIYSFSAACAFGLIMLGQGNKNAEFELTATERLRRCLMESDGPAGEDENGIEEDGIDLNVTAPGATLALGFMYMRTNRKDISDILRPPERPFLLDTVRPDLLLLRTLAICLIHFDEIESTYEWLNRQLPEYITDAWNKRVELNYIEDNIELAYLNIVAGACFALGLKYVGSMDESAYQIVYHFFMYFINSSNPGNSYEGKVRRAALRQAVNMITVALALIVAAHGDVSTYRRLRQYHGGETNNFATKTAMHMATGLIFAGAGRYSFGNSNLAVASLCIAFFPRWPRNWDENRPFLQAYRHLWALAIEPHCLSTVDIDSLQTVYMPLGITAMTGKGDETNTRVHISPTLVADIDQVVTLHPASPRYMFQPLEVSENVAHRQILLDSHALFVRRRTPFLDYFDDPKGNRSLSILTEAINAVPTDPGSKLTGPAILSTEMHTLRDIVSTYANVPWVKGFVERFCSYKMVPADIAPGQSILSQSIISSVVDCLIADRIDLLPRYLDFHFNIDLGDRDFGLMHLKSILWIQRYLPLGHASAIAAGEYAKRYASDWVEQNRDDIGRYWTDRDTWPEMSERTHGLAFYLEVNDVPAPATLLSLRQQVSAARSLHAERRRTTSLPDYAMIREILREASQASAPDKGATALAKENDSVRRKASYQLGWTEASRLNALRAWLARG
ncbi:Anaphase-promoting complex subunit 1 [Naganishia albida]|nr:Anaphase-promoting complex subunit 1 [Naganishia albida]